MVDPIGRKTMSYKHILFAVDLSKSSEVVINKAISLETLILKFHSDKY